MEIKQKEVRWDQHLNLLLSVFSLIKLTIEIFNLLR